MKKLPLSKFFLLILLLWQLTIAVRAETPSFKIFTTEQGLAHDTVNGIVRDSHGFLWFCTSEGLSRFDGRRFTNFTQDDGLPYRNVSAFLELRDRTYLVGTSRGLVVLNPNGKAFRWNVLESKLEQNGDDAPMFQTFAPATNDWHDKNVFSLAQDTNGTIWAGMEYALYRITKNGDDLQFEAVDLDNGLKMNINRLLPDSKGGLIVIGGVGLYRIFQGKIEKFSRTGGDNAMLDLDGKLWVSAGGERTGVQIFEFADGHYRQTQSFTKKDGLADDIHLRTITQMSDGKIYVGGDRVLSEFLPEAKPGDPRFRTLSNDKILALAEDSAGNLWIGTGNKGAWQLSKSGFFRFVEEEGIKQTDEIASIFGNRDGEVFVAVQPNKLFHLGVDGKFENVLPTSQKDRNWGWRFLDFEAHDGEWWIPSGWGLYRYPKVQNIADLARIAPKRIYTKADGIWTSEIFNIFEDSRGDVWMTVSTSGADTLSRWERATDKIYSYSTADGLPKGNGAISFAEDSHGNVWFGHYFGKLARWRGEKFTTFEAKDGLPESQIGDLLTDSGGRLWIATSGYGLFRVDDTDAEKPVFKSVSTADGLSSNQTLCLNQDHFGSVYAGTGHGINRIDRNGVIKIFTQTDGLPGNFVNRCGADAKGNLWFVSQNTLVRFTPKVEESIAPPPVFIDKFSVNGTAQKISVMGETEIKLPDFDSNQTQIEVGFFALNFGVGENIRYQYRLDQQDWSVSSEQQTISLNLAPGRHNFEVRAVRSDGVTSENPAVVSFTILQPLYLRWWFIALSVLALLIIAYAFYYYRLARLEAARLSEEKLRKAKEERLAELEKVRSRIATDLHDDIGASLTQIAILSEVAQAQSKGSSASEPLKMIYNVSNELVGTMSDIVWAINPTKDHLHDLILRMRRFASDVLTAKEIDFEFETPDTEISLNSNLRREVFLIFKEAINNIVKHSEATEVKIDFDISEKDLALTITDNGIGFKTEKIDENSAANLFADYNGGNGLMSIRRRASELGGELEIISEDKKGTTIKLSLPLQLSLSNQVATK